MGMSSVDQRIRHAHDDMGMAPIVIRNWRSGSIQVSIEDDDQLRSMMAIGRIVAAALRHVRQFVKPGVTTAQLDGHMAAFLREHDARHAPQKAYNFPGPAASASMTRPRHRHPRPARHPPWGTW